jgi:hypothetical protein
MLLSGSGWWSLLLSIGGGEGGGRTGGCLVTQHDLQKQIVADVMEGGEMPGPLQLRLQVVVLLFQAM